MKAVQEGMTVSGASKQFSVPRKTLDDRIKGRVKHGCKPGPSTALTAEEECVNSVLVVHGRALVYFDVEYGYGVCMGGFTSLWHTGPLQC